MKRRRNVLRRTKGFRGALKSKERQAKTALLHAGVHAFQHRRKKKRVMRRLWQTKINAAVRARGMSYSRFMSALRKKNIGLDRKILARLAEYEPETFERVYTHITT